MLNQGKTFRSDINLLRAAAVAGVVLYHWHWSMLPGGFAGVDIFFVLSGYLMTRIVLDGLERGNFSLAGFYISRVRRIVPALAALCLVVFGLAQIVIDPLTRQQIISDALASLLFVSNVAYWQSTGYFDVASRSRWLLHTWSLSVEWQFYLLLPVFLLALRRIWPSRRLLLAALWLMALGSLALAAATAQWKPGFAFYLLPSRAWEMLAGGLLYAHAGSWLPGRRQSALLCTAAIALIGIAFVAFDDLMPWPYFTTLVPVAGTLLLLLARPSKGAILDNIVVRTIGLWSYSIYLWHWPILAALRYFNACPGPMVTPAALAATLLVAGLSYRFIETPWREARRDHTDWASWKKLRIASVLCGAMALIAPTSFLGSGAADPAGLSHETQLAQAAMEDAAYPSGCGGVSWRGLLRLCQIGKPAATNVLFIGDSHAELSYAHFQTGRPGYSFVYATYGGCPPLPDVNAATPGYRCNQFFDSAWELAASGRFQKVVISAFWPIYLVPFRQGRDNGHVLCFEESWSCRIARDPDDYAASLDAVFADFSSHILALRLRGIEVTIVLPLPSARNDVPTSVVKTTFRGLAMDSVQVIDRGETLASDAAARQRLEKVVATTGARLVDPIVSMCAAETCPAVDAGGRPLYRDSNHLTAQAVRDGSLDFLDAAVFTPEDASRGVSQAAR